MAKLNDKGQLIVKLPFMEETLTFKRPTGRTIDHIAQFARKAQQEGADVSETNFFATIASQLCTSSKTADDFMDMDAEDYMEVVEALKTFRIFASQV